MAVPVQVDPIFEDLALAPPEPVVLGEAAPEGCAALRVSIGRARADDEATAAAVRDAADRSLAERGVLIVEGDGARSVSELCGLRNRLWPAFHFHRVYRLRAGRPIERTDVNGAKELKARADRDGFLVACHRREAAMSPDVTKDKFDAKAAGWNGEPGSPQYGHFRWMRRLLAQLGRPAPGEETIDAGSGAGWVGIEAALLGARLSSFDPSPEMVRFVEQNARDCGVEVRARVGFCEDPPFDEDFALVLNSGVISFSPDPERFLDGIDRLVRVGGRLVIGDLNPRSRGFLRRRERRLVVPVRELNALSREDVIERLKRRGYEISFVRYYQLTYPIPELNHRTRSHLLAWILLQFNRAASALDAAIGSRAAWLFDSWIIGAVKKR